MITTASEIMRLRLYADELEWHIKAATTHEPFNRTPRTYLLDHVATIRTEAMRLCELRAGCLAAINKLAVSQGTTQQCPSVRKRAQKR